MKFFASNLCAICTCDEQDNFFCLINYEIFFFHPPSDDDKTQLSSTRRGVIRPKDNDDVRKIKFDDKHHMNGFHPPSHLLNRLLFKEDPSRLNAEPNAF